MRAALQFVALLEHVGFLSPKRLIFQTPFVPTSRVGQDGRLCGPLCHVRLRASFFSCFGVGVPLSSSITTKITGGNEIAMNTLSHSRARIFMQCHNM